MSCLLLRYCVKEEGKRKGHEQPGHVHSTRCSFMKQNIFTLFLQLFLQSSAAFFNSSAIHPGHYTMLLCVAGVE